MLKVLRLLANTTPYTTSRGWPVGLQPAALHGRTVSSQAPISELESNQELDMSVFQNTPGNNQQPANKPGQAQQEQAKPDQTDEQKKIQEQQSQQ